MLRRALIPLTLTILALAAIVAALVSFQSLPAPDPPKWGNGPLQLGRFMSIGGAPAVVRGYLQVELKGRYYLTHAEVTLRDFAIAADGVRTSDSKDYREPLHNLVWSLINDPEALPCPPQLAPVIDEAVDNPGKTVSRDFGDAQRDEAAMNRALWMAIAGTAVLIGAGAWLCAVVFPKKRATK